MSRAVVVTVALLASAGPPAAGDTIHVPSDHPTLQAALQAAADGDLVLVEPGLYRGPGNRDLDFAGKAVGLVARREAGLVVIDCEGEGRAFDFHGGEGSATLVRGFVLRGGAAGVGGAVRCAAASSPTLEDLALEDCVAFEKGGGVACLEGSAPTISGCLFQRNSASQGAALYCEASSPVVLRSVFLLNRAYSGGGLYAGGGSAPVVRSAVFRQNRASYGAGAYLDGSAPLIEGCLMEGNSASTAGAGCFLVSSSPAISSTVFRGNEADGVGGAVCCLEGSAPPMTNCLIVGNAANLGGAISFEGPLDTPSLIHCTIADNLGRTVRGGMSCQRGALPDLTNSVVWWNAPESVCGVSSYSITSEDPLFVRRGRFDFNRLARLEVAGEEWSMPDFVLDEGDYSLRESSPGADSGLDEEAPPADLQGNPRPCGPGVDVGAYESCREPEPPFVRGDLSADGRVDIGDPVLVLTHLFLGEPVACARAGDVNDDGREEVADAIHLLLHLFLEGREPAPPYPACGLDPTADAIPCEVHAGCPPEAPEGG